MQSAHVSCTWRGKTRVAEGQDTPTPRPTRKAIFASPRRHLYRDPCPEQDATRSAQDPLLLHWLSLRLLNCVGLSDTAVTVVPCSVCCEIGVGRAIFSMLGVALFLQHGASSGCGWRNGLQLWRLAGNRLNKQPRINDKGWSSGGGGGGWALGNNLHKPRTWTDSLDK
jgi:hypothetical protein